MVDNQIILYKFIKINNNVDWYLISYRYKLSENFIRKFQDKVNWCEISIHQKLSKNFKKEFKHKIKWSITKEFY